MFLPTLKIEESSHKLAAVRIYTGATNSAKDRQLSQIKYKTVIVSRERNALGHFLSETDISHKPQYHSSYHPHLKILTQILVRK
jgi:hypothetical protein